MSKKIKADPPASLAKHCGQENSKMKKITKSEKRDAKQKNKKKMKVSGKSVFQLKNILKKDR